MQNDVGCHSCAAGVGPGCLCPGVGCRGLCKERWGCLVPGWASSSRFELVLQGHSCAPASVATYVREGRKCWTNGGEGVEKRGRKSGGNTKEVEVLCGGADIWWRTPHQSRWLSPDGNTSLWGEPILEQGESVRGKSQRRGTATCCPQPLCCSELGRRSRGEGLKLSLVEPGGKVVFECLSLLLATESILMGYFNLISNFH